MGVVGGRTLWLCLFTTISLNTLFWGALYVESGENTCEYKKVKKPYEQQHEGPIFFTHILNPYMEDNRLPKEQQITVQSMKRATKEASRYGVYAEQVASLFSYDESFFTVHPEIHFGTPYLNRTLRSQLARDSLRPVPFIHDILDRARTNGKGTYVVYSNMDISLHSSFYWKVAQILRETNLSSLSITRAPVLYPNDTAVGLSEIDSYDQIINKINQIREGFPCEWKLGKHPGNDMFIFPRAWIAEMLPRMNNIILGFPPIGCAIEHLLIQKCNEIAPNNTSCYKKFTDLQLTFHIGIGGEGGWNKDPSADTQFSYLYNSLMAHDDLPDCTSIFLNNYCTRCINETTSTIQCPEIWDILVDNKLEERFVQSCITVKKDYNYSPLLT